MTNLDLAKINIFNKLNTNKDIDIVAKKLYLLKAYGFDLGYRFKFYVHGPYSLAFYDDYVELADLYEDIDLKQGVEDVIKIINELDSDKGSLSSLDWYILLSTVAYISDNCSLLKINNIDELKVFIDNNLNHQYSFEDIQKAVLVLSILNIMHLNMKVSSLNK